MENIKDQIEKIVNYKTWDVKKKTDKLFEIDCYLYTNLGIDSTRKETDEVKAMSVYIYRQMKRVDWQLGSAMLHSLDKLM
tara:strand:- start:21 stop:260 length:240 start_codon:yes stop_codon:yes gene_type:complete